MMEELIKRLKKIGIACKEDNWDRYGAPKIEAVFIEKVILELDKYIEPFVKLNIPVEKIHVAPTSSGKIQFEAEHGPIYVELECGDEDEYGE